jgi:hypothetical protein
MRLIVQLVDAPAVPGGRALAICDEAGELLPMQVNCDVLCGVDGMCKAVATFLIDGKDVRFVE